MNTTELFGRYSLGQRLAGHVFAEVYVARVDLPGGGTRALAIKRTLPEMLDEAIGNALLEPASKASQLLHPHIVALFELGRQNGQAFVAMELVEGPSLGQLLEAARRAKLSVPLPVQVHIALGCARAVAAAHGLRPEGDKGPRQPLLHGGLSPSNVLIGNDGQVKVTDFGLTPTALDSTTVPLGYYRSKLPYNPPERFLGEPITALSDIYGLGLLLFELAVGRAAFAAKTDAQLIRAVCEDPPPQPRKLNKQVSEGLDKLILKAMARKPAQRPKSAEAMIKELEGLLPRDAGDGATAIAAFVGQVEQALGESLGPRSEEATRSSVSSLPAAPSPPPPAPSFGGFGSPFDEVTAPPPPVAPVVPPTLEDLFDEVEEPPAPPGDFSFANEKTVADMRVEDIQARLAERRTDVAAAPEAEFEENTVVTQLPVGEFPGLENDAEPFDGSRTFEVVEAVTAAQETQPPGASGEGRSSFGAATETLTPEQVAALPKANLAPPERGATDLSSLTEPLPPETTAELAATGRPAEPVWRKLWGELRLHRWWLVWGASAVILVVAISLLVLALDEDDAHVTRVEALTPSEVAQLTGAVAGPLPVSEQPGESVPPETAEAGGDEALAAGEAPEEEINEPSSGGEVNTAVWGVVALSSEPPAEIILRGKKLGLTPKDLRLPAGSYRVTLINDADKLQKTVKITVRAGARVEERVKLGPVDAMVKPESTSKIDPPAKAPPSKAEPLAKVPPRKSEPPVKESDDSAKTPEVTVGGATLVVTAKPWADVYIDGIKVGTTPLPPIPIAPGNHTIDLDNPELGKSKRLPIKIKAGKPYKLKVDLTK